MHPNDVTITLHHGSIPPFTEAEMARLYRHIYSSLALLRPYGAIGDDTYTYVARKGATVCAVLLFRVNGNHVQPVNEQIPIDAAEIERFARYVFATWPAVQIVSFHAIRSDIHRFSFVHQRTNVLEDIVLELPRSADDYMARLGKATRKNIRHHLSRMTRSFPTAEHKVYAGDGISEQHVRTIVGFNRARMARKSRISSLDDDEAARLLCMVRERGFISVIMIDGEVRAGAIVTQVGRNFFTHVNAHDPVYDNFRLGTLCCYLTIVDCIARGGAEFHFLWGRYEYKYMLLGVQRELQDVVLYRSAVHFVLCSGTALKQSADHHLRNARHWMLEKTRTGPGLTLRSKLVFHLLTGLRALKQMAVGARLERK